MTVPHLAGAGAYIKAARRYDAFLYDGREADVHRRAAFPDYQRREREYGALLRQAQQHLSEYDWRMFTELFGFDRDEGLVNLAYLMALPAPEAGGNP